jgi:uncharacterized Zn-finger protein
MFGPGCSVPETLSTNTTWIVTCTTAMFALDVIVQDIFLEESYHEIRDDKSYLCSVCGKILHSFSGLRRHNMNHQDKKKWECQICHKTEVILFHKGFVANLAFPFLFVLVVHIVTPQTAEAVENFPTN